MSDLKRLETEIKKLLTAGWRIDNSTPEFGQHYVNAAGKIVLCDEFGEAVGGHLLTLTEPQEGLW